MTSVLGTQLRVFCRPRRTSNPRYPASPRRDKKEKTGRRHRNERNDPASVRLGGGPLARGGCLVTDQSWWRRVVLCLVYSVRSDARAGCRGRTDGSVRSAESRMGVHLSANLSGHPSPITRHFFLVNLPHLTPSTSPIPPAPPRERHERIHRHGRRMNIVAEVNEGTGAKEECFSNWGSFRGKLRVKGQDRRREMRVNGGRRSAVVQEERQLKARKIKSLSTCKTC